MQFTHSPIIQRQIKHYELNRHFVMSEPNSIIRRDIRRDAISSARAALWAGPKAVIACYRAQIIRSHDIAAKTQV